MISRARVDIHGPRHIGTLGQSPCQPVSIVTYTIQIGRVAAGYETDFFEQRETRTGGWNLVGQEALKCAAQSVLRKSHGLLRFRRFRYNDVIAE